MHFITSTLVVMASGLLPVFALPHKAPVETRSYTPQSSFSPLGRLNPTYTTEQLNAMKLALTFDERLKLMESFGDPDLYFKFDFTPAGFQSNAGNGQGGQGYPAAVQNYPILLGTGLSMAIGFLGPCGLDSMHTHPRATELLILVNGTSLKTGFVQEDGDYDSIITTLGLYQGTIRPQGSVHYEFNDNCSPAIFVTGLSSEDPGVQRSAQALFTQDPDLVYADLGYPKNFNNVNLTAFEGSIPAAFALGAQECLKRCGVTYNATQH